ncbi:HD domain-containing protein [Candidatus Sulfurimonas baltica]|uniref:HD domain-containing protein n=1 Tax=Candidatus Sulfurimonas baltica TaxID=2740404 RepID=A0A7S7RNV6_9BACT|nr:HD domain-containing protein [Candidatus Sulfurimonas baltica]QOY52946.1 HD domain-containing protein [Candidatus Sulfurimonas baltica]
MNKVNNSLFSIPFLKSLFFTQNKWHQHGVLAHTLRVTYNILKAGEWKFFMAGILHDIGKPFTAYKKDKEDVEYNEYSFTDHEERSYQIIKNWPFISKYTKDIVRYHYLIRDIKKSEKEDLPRFYEKKEIWETLDETIKADLDRFMLYDDLGKGDKKR